MKAGANGCEMQLLLQQQSQHHIPCFAPITVKVKAAAKGVLCDVRASRQKLDMFPDYPAFDYLHLPLASVKTEKI